MRVLDLPVKAAAGTSKVEVVEAASSGEEVEAVSESVPVAAEVEARVVWDLKRLSKTSTGLLLCHISLSGTEHHHAVP